MCEQRNYCINRCQTCIPAIQNGLYIIDPKIIFISSIMLYHRTRPVSTKDHSVMKSEMTTEYWSIFSCFTVSINLRALHTHKMFGHHVFRLCLTPQLHILTSFYNTPHKSRIYCITILDVQRECHFISREHYSCWLKYLT